MKNSMLSFALVLAFTAVAKAQESTVSSPADRATTHVVGTEPSLFEHSTGSGFRFDGALFVNFQQQLGDRGGDDTLFSTNFLQLEARREFGGRSVLAGRVTGSIEPLTTEDTYPALYRLGVDREGNPLVDEQAGQRFITEAALEAATSIGSHVALYVYAAPVGVPAFGIAPLRQRASAAMIPFTTLSDEMYTFADRSTNVITAGGMLGPVTLEASRFDYGMRGDELMADDDFEATAFRAAATIGIARLQASVAELDDAGSTRHTSASVTFASRNERRGYALTLAAAEVEDDVTADSDRGYLGELAWRFGRNTVSARVNSAERLGLFDPVEEPEIANREFTIDAFSFGYARDFVQRAVVISAGFHLTYFQQPRSFEPYGYGHKPQATVFFVKFAPRGSRLSLVD